MRGSPTEVVIYVNGEERDLPEAFTIAGLLDYLKTGERQVAVARNGEIIPRSDFDALRVAPGDRIEIVHAIGGGAGAHGRGAGRPGPLPGGE